MPILASGDLLRSAVAAGTPLGREADRYMGRGQLVPDDTIVRVFLDRLERARCPRRRDPRRLPADARQAEALDGRSSEAGRRVDRAMLIEVAPEDLVRRMSERRICTANGHVYNLASNPPRVDGVCDLDGSALVQRPDDDEATVRARMDEQIRRCSRSSTTTARPASCRPVDGREPIAAVSERLLRAARVQPGQQDRRSRGHPQVASRDRQDAPGRPHRRRGARARRVGAQARRHDRPPRPARRAPHPGGRGRAVVQGLRPSAATRSRRACASRSTTRSSTASPASASIRDGQIVSVDAGAIFDGWHGDGARTLRRRRVRRRRSQRAGRRDAPGDDGRHRGRGAGRAPRRHLGRDRGRRGARTATASSASSSATASARRCTRSRRSRTTGPAPAA